MTAGILSIGFVAQALLFPACFFVLGLGLLPSLVLASIVSSVLLAGLTVRAVWGEPKRDTSIGALTSAEQG